jgi:arylsulfatase A-like enzyme
VRAFPPPRSRERELDRLPTAATSTSLLAVDRAVERIVAALRETGRLRNTLFVYTSDNGLAWGEHRWSKKEAPPEEIASRSVVRWNAGGVVSARRSTRWR